MIIRFLIKLTRHPSWVAHFRYYNKTNWRICWKLYIRRSSKNNRRQLS